MLAVGQFSKRSPEPVSKPFAGARRMARKPRLYHDTVAWIFG
jgi:hypothetical protein